MDGEDIGSGGPGTGETEAGETRAGDAGAGDAGAGETDAREAWAGDAGAGDRDVRGGGRQNGGPRAGARPAGAPSGAHGSAGRPLRPPLERRSGGRVIAGVCGALGRHLSIDPVVFRIVIAVLCVSGGIGLFIYGLAWLIIPIAAERPRSRDAGKNELQRLLGGQVDAQSLGAVLITLLGTAVLFAYMSQGSHVFALLLIALLTVAALRYDPARHQRSGPPYAAPAERPGPGASGRPAPPSEPTAPVPPPARPWWLRSAVDGEPGDGPARDLPDATAQPEDARPADAVGADAVRADAPGADALGADGPRDQPQARPPAGPPAGSPLAPDSARYAPPPFEPPYQHERSCLGAVFLLLALAAGGAVWGVAASHGRTPDVLTVLAVALLVLALGLLAGARRGRGRWLAVPAFLLTLLLVGASTLPSGLRDSQGSVRWAPATAAAVRPSYQLGAGRADLDLRSVDPAGAALSLRARIGAGKLLVHLPADVEARITAKAGVGQVSLPGTNGGEGKGGFGVHETTVLPADGPGPSRGTLSLTLDVGAGQLEVTR